MKNIIENTIKSLHPSDDDCSHLILGVLFDKKHFKLLDLAISTYDKKERENYNIRSSANGKPYDTKFKKAVVGLRSESSELLQYLVPDFISINEYL